MRIALCDDNREYRDRLGKMLKNYFKRRKIDDYEIRKYTSGLVLLEEFSCGGFDFIFLDIEMPELGGFETAEHIIKIDRKVGIIFFTISKDHVYSSFRFKPKDFLCKPVTQQKIDELMDRLLEERDYREENDFYVVDLKTGGTISLFLPNVPYFESDNNYVIAVSVNEEYIFRSSMKKVSFDLKDRGFTQISRKHIVNNQYVFKVFNDYIAMKTGVSLSIGRKYKDEVRGVFKGVW